jgi:predicted ATP-grasp superfamily ATP-dependent carboligase
MVGMGTSTAPVAIVLSGNIIGLGAVRALGEAGIPVVLASIREEDPTVKSRHVVARLSVPDPEADEEAFVAALEAAATRYPGAVLMPAADAMLVGISRHKARLERAFRVACADWSAAEKFVDKQFTYALAAAAGVPVPRTVVPHSVEELERYATDVRYPVLVKPSQSHLYSEVFGRKLTQVEDLGELRAAYGEAAARGLDVMLQELIPGDDDQGTSYNCYMWDGEPLLEFTSAKVRLLPHRYGRPSSMVSRWIPELLEPGRATLRAAGFNGYANIEFKRDPRDGVHKLMEVNARMNLVLLLAVRSGINYPALIYRHLAFREVPRPIRQTTGTYWVDGGRDIVAGVRAVAERRTSLRDFLRPYVRPHVYAVFDPRDPRPAVARYAGYAGAALSRVASRLRPNRS